MLLRILFVVLALAAGLARAEAARTLPTPSASEARVAGPDWLSGSLNNYNLSLTAAQDLLVFARSEAEFAHARILFARRGADGWSLPEALPFSDARYRDSDPWLTPDGQWLYFTSDRPTDGSTTARKDFDLWRVRVAGGWGQPEHLDGVNSAGMELGPELHDGWLYFNSTRPGGPARLSIYRARQRADGGFDAPEPLPAPFNSGFAQGDFTLSPDGRTALFWRKQDAAADADLYAVRRTAAGWGAAVHLPAPFSAPGFDFTPAFGPDGESIYFASTRGAAAGMAKLYVVARAALEQALDQAAR
ncbi:hypothetical protein [Massilia sp. TS11]|uniref:TolB family protein n=1 Tax=Massilia sp. TS11 TaxID=2908003 RepID=UPI001EDAC20F|nr:hypothetical protein [Massilia sp. TS11]MCG2586391.1 hypothetical protein [Massilia sp. TS11]